MKKNLFRISSLLVLAAMLFSFAACNPVPDQQTILISMIYDEASPYKPGTSGGAATPSGSGSVTPAPNNNNNPTPAPTTPGNDTPAPTTPGNDTPAPSTPGNDTPAPAAMTKEEIHQKYADIVKQMKTTVKSYTRKEFQEVQNLDVGAASGIVNSLIPNFLKTEDQATAEPKEGGGGVPPWGTDEGSLLTDVSFLKDATYKENGDGTATIVLVTNNETNPEPASDGTTPSKTGAIFAPLKKKDIDDTLAGISAIKVENFSLDYHDCTATLTYDIASGQMKSLNQIMNIDVDASLKVVFSIHATATIITHMVIADIVF